MDISHPASTPDYLAFGTPPICKKLETEGSLCGLYIYGDNAYANTLDITTP